MQHLINVVLNTNRQIWFLSIFIPFIIDRNDRCTKNVSKCYQRTKKQKKQTCNGIFRQSIDFTFRVAVHLAGEEDPKRFRRNVQWEAMGKPNTKTHNNWNEEQEWFYTKRTYLERCAHETSSKEIKTRTMFQRFFPLRGGIHFAANWFFYYELAR